LEVLETQMSGLKDSEDLEARLGNGDGDYQGHWVVATIGGRRVSVPWDQGTLDRKPNNCPRPIQGGTPGSSQHPRPD
jgi:hypothetical protein